MKKASRAPVIIAPIMLVATNSIARSINDAITVPIMPVSKRESAEHLQLRTSLLRIVADNISVSARNTIAIPNKTHKNTGVIVITALMRRIAATTPTIKLKTIATPAQSLLQQQSRLDIFYSHPISIYA